MTTFGFDLGIADFSVLFVYGKELTRAANVDELAYLDGWLTQFENLIGSVRETEEMLCT